MTTFLLRRLLWAVPLVLASSFFVFVLVAQAGDPLADLRFDPDVPAEVIASLEHELKLDRPVLERYAGWLGSAVRGDLGDTVNGRAVRGLLWERLQVTLRMVVAALGLAIACAILVGAVSALRPQSLLDTAIMVISLVFISLPLFWLGGVLKEFLAVRLNGLVGRRIVATAGQSDPVLPGDLLHRLGNYASHLVLPTLALTIVLVAAWSRYVRASMIEELSQDYVAAARAKGLSPWKVATRHGLRVALVPFAGIVAVDFAQVLGGVVILEQVFGWTGMGRMLIDGIRNSDTNVVLAWLAASAVVVIAFNVAADLAVGWLDPRARRG